MGWQRRGERNDPARVLEEKQERQAARRNWVNWETVRVDPFGAVWFGEVQVMTRDESEQVEELVMLWYRWTAGYRPHLGGPRVSPYVRGGALDEAQPTRDDADDHLDARLAEQVEVCIDELRWQLRSAVGIHAANKAAGAKVYRNPRLTEAEQHAAYQEAKTELLPALRRRSLVRDVEPGSAKACNWRAATS